MAAEKGELTVFNFDKPGDENAWRTIDDVVMGGISSSTWKVTADGTAMFTGTVSLENNGGFSSVRSRAGSYDLSNYKGIALRVKGDGKQYKLNIKTDAQFDSIMYQGEFATEKGIWQIVKMPFAKFVATYHGAVLSDVPKLDIKSIRTFGFLIANKQKGPFQLEIDWIKAYSD